VCNERKSIRCDGSDQALETVTLTKNVDPFLLNLMEVWDKNPNIQDSLAAAVLRGLVVKAKGHKNAEFPAQVMNFYIALESTSRKAFDFVSTNFLGPAICSVQRNNAKTQEKPIILCDKETIHSRLEFAIEKIADKNHPVAMSLSFDRTKVPTSLALSTSFKAIIGGSIPNHVISVEGQSEN